MESRLHQEICPIGSSKDKALFLQGILQGIAQAIRYQFTDPDWLHALQGKRQDGCAVRSGKIISGIQVMRYTPRDASLQQTTHHSQ
jgi:hypothetical protein